MTEQSTVLSVGGSLFLATTVMCVGALLSCQTSPSPLVNPVMEGDVATVSQLLASGVDPNGTDFKRRNLLELAILKQQTEVIQLLVSKGADLNLVGKYGNTPIGWTAERGNAAITKILLEAGANPDAITRRKNPTLYEAVDRGHSDVALLLIRAGADPNAVGPKSQGTALHQAIVKNQPLVVRDLVLAGANLQAVDLKNRTPRELANSLGRVGPIMQALDGQVVARQSPKPKPRAKPRATPKAKPKPRPQPRATPIERDLTAPTISGANSLYTRTAAVQIDLLVKDNSTVRDVRIDGRLVVLDPEGRLRMRRSVPEGNSLILITAVDEWGNEANYEIHVAREILAPIRPGEVPGQQVAWVPELPSPPRIPAIDFGRYNALVIGNNNYSELPKLRTATNDAISVSAILRDDYDYEVTTLIDATRSDILRAFQTLRNELTTKDNLLIFYAGHGWLDVDGDQGYWLPTDATRGDPVNWISNADISSAVRAIKANHVLVVADSCFSGKLTRGMVLGSKRSGPNATSHLEKLIGKRARVVLTSGGLEPVDDGSGSHSVFASEFISALRSNQGVLEGHELFQKIRRPVMLATDQVPDYGDMRKAGHDGGDFLFVRRN